MKYSGHDTLKTRRQLSAGGKTYDYYSLPVAAEAAGLGDISRLPFSLRVLLENLVRLENGRTVTVDDIKAVGAWLNDKTSMREIAFRSGPRADAGLHRRAGGLRSGRDARRHGRAGRRSGADQPAVAGRSGHRPFGHGR